jgi:signal transduction histidine kinase
MYPFWYSAEHPEWMKELETLHAEPVEQNGQRVGVVYLDLDRRALMGVRASIGIVLGLIVVALLTLTGRIFTQEKVLTATTQILEENQRELIRLERLSLAGLLTANIFHDIRKPMTNIKHEIGDLSEALGGFAGATRALRNIREQVNLFFDILNDLNIERFVRADQADEEYVDINRVVEQSLRLVQYERGSTQLSVSLAPGLPLILARPFRLVQVFSNLVLNAYEALQGRGELRILTRTDGTQVSVEIADNGPGIPPADLERIFSPFFTGKSPDKGTGLGLYISRSIVEQMGGTIRGDSTVGHGATFTVSIPVSE